MTWVKLDDQLHSHPKVLRAWKLSPVSLGLHMLALSHTGAYLTLGHVPEEFVSGQMLSRAQRDRATKALVAAGLWEPAEGGWQIHDFLVYNDFHLTVIEKREGASRARTHAGARASAGPGVPARPVPDLLPQLASCEDRI